MKVKIIESTNFEWFEIPINAFLAELEENPDAANVQLNYFLLGDPGNTLYIAVIEYDISK